MDNKKLQSILNDYNKRIEELKTSNNELRYKLNRVNTVSYGSGIPDTSFNRGDEGDAFAFPYKWASTCKRLANSLYLSPILDFMKMTFNTFNYKLEPAKGNYKLTNQINDFLEKQFDNIGGLNRWLVNLAYGALQYGFNYFTMKTESKKQPQFGFKTTLQCLRDVKFYDVALTNKFIFDDDDVDNVIAVSFFSASKETAYIDNDFVLEQILQGNRIQGDNITIPLEKALGGLITLGNNYGDPVGKPFLYSTYMINQVLESMDNSFYKNLDAVGEHSYNFVPFKSEYLSEAERQNVYNEVLDFIDNKGGVFVSSYGKLEKIEGLDAREWYEFRDGVLSTIYKSKGLDIKALGLNRGATRNLAELTQTDTVLMCADMMRDFIFQVNRTFMRWYFDCNFKYERLNGLCDYFNIIVEVPDKELNQTQSNIDMSAINNKSNANTKKQISNRGNSQYSVYASNGKVVNQVTSLNVDRFIKGKAEGNLEYIIDTTYLNDVLNNSSDELLKDLIAEGKNNIRNTDFIEALLRNKKNIPSIFNKGSEDKLRATLEYNVNQMLDVKANEILYGFKKSNIADFKDITGMSVNEWKQKELNKFMNKSGNRLVKQVISKAETQIKQDLEYYIDSVDKTDIDTAISEVQNNLYDYKMTKLQDITDRETINLFQDVSRQANTDVSKKSDVVLIRVAVLESACDVCRPKAGRTFVKDSNGNWYNENYAYEDLPDKNCLGTKQRCNCYYVIADKNYIDTLDFANSQKNMLQGV